MTSDIVRKFSVLWSTGMYEQFVGLLWEHPLTNEEVEQFSAEAQHIAYVCSPAWADLTAPGGSEIPPPDVCTRVIAEFNRQAGSWI